MEIEVKTQDNSGVTMNTAAYFMIMVSIMVVVAVGYFSKYLVGKWGETVGNARYQLESNTLMDECEEKDYGHSWLTQEDKVDDDGDKYELYTFGCTYKRYEK